MKKILIVISTRPDTIKMAPIIEELKRHSSIIEPVIVTVGQHRAMLTQMINIFSIKVDYSLDIMVENQDIYHITMQTLQGLRKIINKIKPDMILVQGDTTTTFASSLCAFYERIPIGHIEAGLRSCNKYSPYPEEMNRVLTDHLSDICFAPTNIARDNLLKEGIPQKKILVTGNTSIDALFMALNMEYKIEGELKNIIDSNRRIVVVTAHRRENFNKPIKHICKALLELHNRFSDIEIVYSVHPNPNVKGPVYEMLGHSPHIRLIEPLDYLHFINLMKHCTLILTDSGGIQEEAPSLNKPVLVMREVTERTEGIKVEASLLVGTSEKKIVQETSSLLTDEKRYRSMASAPNPYGDGKASKRIVKALI